MGGGGGRGGGGGINTSCALHAQVNNHAASLLQGSIADTLRPGGGGNNSSHSLHTQVNYHASTFSQATQLTQSEGKRVASTHPVISMQMMGKKVPIQYSYKWGLPSAVISTSIL